MFRVRWSMVDVRNLRRARHFAANCFDCFVRPDEKLELHLLELARAESEVARVDLVPKCLSDLANTEGHFLARRFEHVLELRENGLGGLGTEIRDVFFALDRTDVGFEHQIELARRCEFSTFACTILRVKAY